MIELDIDLPGLIENEDGCFVLRLKRQTKFQAGDYSGVCRVMRVAVLPIALLLQQ